MRPFDPRLLTQVPATRKPVLALGAIGAGQGLATIALAFAVTNLVVAVAEGRAGHTPVVWLVGLFAFRGLLAVATERFGSWAGRRVWPARAVRPPAPCCGGCCLWRCGAMDA